MVDDDNAAGVEMAQSLDKPCVKTFFLCDREDEAEAEAEEVAVAATGGGGGSGGGTD
jgi:hypothetical protein